MNCQPLLVSDRQSSTAVQLVRCAGQLIVLALLCLAGCSPAGSRIPVYGKIVGAEGRDGTISFLPANGETGPSAIAEIQQGTYRCTAEDGPEAGPHVARILLDQATQPTGTSVADNPKLGKPPTRKPAAGNDKPLAEYTIEVEIPAQAPFEIDITLPNPK